MPVFHSRHRAAGILITSIIFSVGSFSTTFAAGPRIASAPPATHTDGGTVTGTLLAPSGQSLTETVVYLESDDPLFRFTRPAQPVVVSQRGGRFAPPLTVICVGQTVEFVNDEESSVEHNVFSQSPAQSFDLGLYPPGVSKSVTFEKAGPVRLHCSIHRNMDGVVYVCPTPYYAKVSADGSFVIDAVPPGTYSLHSWQRRQRFLEVSVPVRVAAGETASLKVEMSRK